MNLVLQQVSPPTPQRKDSALDKMNQLKMFTIAEANALIPQIRSLLKQLQQKKREIALCEVKIDAAEILNPRSGNEQSPEVEALLKEYEDKVNSFYANIDEIHGMGCYLKDIELGLIDFYSVYEGRVVYLCWKAGEEAVGHWHEIGKGFSCRQPFKLERNN